MLTTIRTTNIVRQPVYPRSCSRSSEKFWKKLNPRSNYFHPVTFYTCPTVGIFALDGFSQGNGDEAEPEEEEEELICSVKTPTLAKMNFIISKNAGIWSSKRIIISSTSLLNNTIRIDNTLSITAESIASAFFTLGVSALIIAETNVAPTLISYDSYDIATTAFSIAHSMAISCPPLLDCLSEKELIVGAYHLTNSANDSHAAS